MGSAAMHECVLDLVRHMLVFLQATHTVLCVELMDLQDGAGCAAMQVFKGASVSRMPWDYVH
jgi:hypothetical protein